MAKRKRPRPFADVVKDVPTFSESLDGKFHARYFARQASLWDENGRYWKPDRRLDLVEVEPLLRQGVPLVTAGENALRFVPATEAVGTWRAARAEEEDDDWRGWSPSLYRHGDQHLVLLRGYC